MEPQQGGIKTWQWVVTVIVVIALIIIGILVFGSKKTAPSTSSSTEMPSPVATSTSQNSIIMSDQFPGNVVYLSSVQASQPVWVVIQSDNNGQPGDIIGSAHFDAGINPGKITITTPTIDGNTYYAVMYTDDGSNSFNATTDTPLKDANGNVIMRVFHASSAANAQIKG